MWSGLHYILDLHNRKGNWQFHKIGPFLQPLCLSNQVFYALQQNIEERLNKHFIFLVGIWNQFFPFSFCCSYEEVFLFAYLLAYFFVLCFYLLHSWRFLAEEKRVVVYIWVLRDKKLLLITMFIAYNKYFKSDILKITVIFWK